MYIGIDIEDVSRFENKEIDKDSKFLSRIFTQNELEYCFKNKNYAQSLTARYCAKEAVVKALSSCSNELISYNKIEVLNYQNGVPYVNILADDFKKYDFKLTLSHEKDKAIAFVIVVEKGE